MSVGIYGVDPNSGTPYTLQYLKAQLDHEMNHPSGQGGTGVVVAGGLQQRAQARGCNLSYSITTHTPALGTPNPARRYLELKVRCLSSAAAGGIPNSAYDFKWEMTLHIDHMDDVVKIIEQQPLDHLF